MNSAFMCLRRQSARQHRRTGQCRAPQKYEWQYPTATIASIVIRLRTPAGYFFREFVEAGGLMSYGPNLPDLWRQSARLVAKILKGDNPANLPFELPTRYELIVNVKTAKEIGLRI